MCPAKSQDGVRPLLQVEDLSVLYTREGSETHAVRDVDLTVDRGEVVGLVGESGSGKSSLALALMQYLPGSAQVSGAAVRLDGVDLLTLPRRRLREIWGTRMSMVYQNPGAVLNPSLRVGRQLEEVARFHFGISRRDAREQVLAVLEKVQMPGAASVMERYPHQLSGGMVQRCVIAMALVADPDLLLMDEPTTALDVTTQAAVLDLLSDLRQEIRAAILYITHDLGVVAGLCDRIGVMYAGRLVEEGPVDRIYRRPRHPYTLGLLACVPRFTRGRELHALPEIPGSPPRPGERMDGCAFAPRCPLAAEVCRVEHPGRRLVSPGHDTACFFWEEVPPPEIGLHPVPELKPRSRSDGEPLVKAEGLVKKYASSAERGLLSRRGNKMLRAVDGVDIAVGEGRTLGLVGESGCGKTTAARLIAGLVRPTEGRIRLQGDELPAWVGRRSRGQLQNLQMVFQNPEATLNPYRTVGHAVLRPLLCLRDVGRREAEKIAADLLAAVDLPSAYSLRFPEELSGGEKQRVAVARAFAAGPKLVLADEPISSLDVSVQGRLMNLLLRLQGEGGTSYLFISHDLAVVEHLSDDIAVMYLGVIVERGPAKQVLRPPCHPYTEALLSAIPDPDPAAEGNRVRLPGSVPSASDIPPGCRFHPRCPRFLGEECVESDPGWREGEAGHRIRCHIPLPELALLQGNGDGWESEDGPTGGTPW